MNNEENRYKIWQKRNYENELNAAKHEVVLDSIYTAISILGTIISAGCDIAYINALKKVGPRINDIEILNSIMGNLEEYITLCSGTTIGFGLAIIVSSLALLKDNSKKANLEGKIQLITEELISANNNDYNNTNEEDRSMKLQK